MKRETILIVLLLLPVLGFAQNRQEQSYSEDGKCTVVIMFCPSNSNNEIKGLNYVDISINRTYIQKLPLNHYLTIDVTPQDLLFYFSCDSSDEGNGDIEELNEGRTRGLIDYYDYFSAEFLKPEAGKTYYLCVYRPSYNIIYYTFKENFLEEDTALAKLDNLTEMPVLWNQIGQE